MANLFPNCLDRQGKVRAPFGQSISQGPVSTSFSRWSTLNICFYERRACDPKAPVPVAESWHCLENVNVPSQGLGSNLNSRSKPNRIYKCSEFRAVFLCASCGPVFILLCHKNGKHTIGLKHTCPFPCWNRMKVLKLYLRIHRFWTVGLDKSCIFSFPFF